MIELLSLIATVIAILVGGFIAYHIYFLQKKLSFTDKMGHMEIIRNKTEKRLQEIDNNGISREVLLVNVKRYERDYEGPNNRNRHGYVELRAELKAVRYNGVEFFEGIREAYYDEHHALTLKQTSSKAFNVFSVGLVPFDWIEYVDLRGDEFRYSPIFYTKFKGKHNHPYKKTLYYRERDGADNSGPSDMRYERVAL